MRLSIPLGQQLQPLQSPPPLSPFLQFALANQAETSPLIRDSDDWNWTPSQKSLASPAIAAQSQVQATTSDAIAPLSTTAGLTTPSSFPIQRQPLGNIKPLVQLPDFLLVDELPDAQSDEVSASINEDQQSANNDSETVAQSETTQAASTYPCSEAIAPSEVELPEEFASPVPAVVTTAPDSLVQAQENVNTASSAPLQPDSVSNVPATEVAPEDGSLVAESAVITSMVPAVEAPVVSSISQPEVTLESTASISKPFQTESQASISKTSIQASPVQSDQIEIAQTEDEITAPQSLLPRQIEPIATQETATQFTQEQLANADRLSSAVEETISPSSTSDEPAIAESEPILPLDAVQLKSEALVDSTIDDVEIVDRASDAQSVNQLESLRLQPEQKTNLDLTSEIRPTSHEQIQPQLTTQDITEITSLEAVKGLEESSNSSVTLSETIGVPDRETIPVSLTERSPNFQLSSTPEASSIRLKPLSAPEPLAQVSDFLIPDLEKQNIQRSSNETSETTEALADLPTAFTTDESITNEFITDEPFTQSLQATALPVLESPDSWSSLVELLGEQPDTSGVVDPLQSSETTRSTEPSIHAFTQANNPNQNSNPFIQRSSSELTGATSEEWSSLAELMDKQAETKPITEESLAFQTFPVSPIESAPVTLVSPLIQMAPQAELTEQNNEKSPQDFEKLAQAVYRLIQTQLEVDRERRWDISTGSLRWVSGTIVSSNGLKGEQSMPEFELSEGKLKHLSQQIYVWLEQRLEIDRERKGNLHI